MTFLTAHLFFSLTQAEFLKSKCHEPVGDGRKVAPAITRRLNIMRFVPMLVGCPNIVSSNRGLKVLDPFKISFFQSNFGTLFFNHYQ